MPEPYRYSRKVSDWTLSRAHGVGQVVRVECGLCNIKRHYYPADLKTLLGDISADEIRMRCDRCQKSEFVNALFVRLSGPERQSIRMRKLAEVRMVRKVIWQDE